jgi:hypothetical protein
MLNDDQKADLAIITDHNQWASIVFAMVKRGDNRWPDCAFLVKGHGPKLYHKNMFELFELEGGPLSTRLVGVPTIEFESFEAMLEAGWEVD